MPGSPITSGFVEAFNAQLEAIPSAARVARSSVPLHQDLLELHDEDGEFLEFLPASATPEIVAKAYFLYGLGLNRGTRAGEAAAWAKLRTLIGAAPVASPL